MRGASRAAALALVLAGCGGEPAPVVDRAEPEGAAGPAAWETPEARAELARAPDSMACEEDADCVPFHGGGTAPPAVCCDDSTTGVTTRAYLQWVESFRARHCAGARCESPPVPGALPADCFFEGRCVEGRCTTQCETREGGGAPPAP